MDGEEKFKSKFFYGVGVLRARAREEVRFAPTTPTLNNFFEKIFFFWLRAKVCSAKKEKEKSSAQKEKENALLCVETKLKTKMPGRVLSLQTKFQKQIAMKNDFNYIKALVGATNVIITSEFRYSELHALVEKASVLEKGILTIKVRDCTLRTDEITALAKLGGAYVAFDLTEC